MGKCKIRKCRVCEKEIKVMYEHKGSNQYKAPIGSRRTDCYSEEGVVFLHGVRRWVWFCNACWELIISKVQISKKEDE